MQTSNGRKIMEGLPMVKMPPKNEIDPPAPAPALCSGGAREKLLHDPADLARWCHAANYGETAIYHTGLLATDRLALGHSDRMANAAQAQAAAGFVLLTQRRVSAISCEYRITRLRTVQPGLGWWSQ